MSLTQEQIEKLSKDLSKVLPQNEKKLIWDVNSIIWYIDILNDIDTTWVKPTVSVIESENTLRKDNISSKSTRKELLSCTNQVVVGDQIALTSIMK